MRRTRPPGNLTPGQAPGRQGDNNMSDLIVIGYPDEETAAKVWQELVQLQKDYLVGLGDAAVIRRAKKLHVTTPAHHAVAWGTPKGLCWGTGVGLLLPFPPRAVACAAGRPIG